MRQILALAILIAPIALAGLPLQASHQQGHGCSNPFQLFWPVDSYTHRISPAWFGGANTYRHTFNGVTIIELAPINGDVDLYVYTLDPTFGCWTLLCSSRNAGTAIDRCIQPAIAASWTVGIVVQYFSSASGFVDYKISVTG